MHIVHQKKQETSKSQRASESTSEDIAVLAFLVKVRFWELEFRKLLLRTEIQGSSLEGGDWEIPLHIQPYIGTLEPLRTSI